MRTFLGLFAVMYPCSQCSDHFQREVASAPPDVSSRAGLVRWMCELHNSVNKRLGRACERCA
jgi:FAD-linked sulfhydryl oxidase